MKINYEKYDDTVQYLNNDKASDWTPSSEHVCVNVTDESVTVTTHYQNGLVASLEMTIVERSDGRLIAQHLDDHMGITVFVHNPNESAESTLTLINNNYIVGRYLRRVEHRDTRQT